MTEPKQPTEEARNDALAAFTAADRSCAFGPTFFVMRLGSLVRDRCPEPGELLPAVEIYLADGGVLDVCHVVAVSARWLILAVNDPVVPGGMMTDIIPYEAILRVRVRARAKRGREIGFDAGHPPAIVAAEALLDAAMAPELRARERSELPEAPAESAKAES